MKWLIAALLGLLLAILSPVSTFAAAPSQDTFSGTLTQFLAGTDPGNPCGFDMIAVTSGDVHVMTFVDQEGNPTRQLIYQPVKHTYASVDTSGNVIKSISAKGPAPAHIDLQTGLQTSTGNQTIITLPGSGVVLGTAGNVVYDTRNGYQPVASTGLNTFDAAAFCSAIAP